MSTLHLFCKNYDILKSRTSKLEIIYSNLHIIITINLFTKAGLDSVNRLTG